MISPRSEKHIYEIHGRAPAPPSRNEIRFSGAGHDRQCWLIGATSLLVAAFDVALEPYAWHVKHFWLWQPTKFAVNWHGASPLNFIGWGCAALLILMFITPSLIRKQPGNPSAADLSPVALWLGAITLFAVNSAQAGEWAAVIADILIAGVAALFSWRGVKW